jgi:membrane-bound lytic murein transglycosylase MltF
MPVSRDHLIPALLSGQADIAAADLTITDARSGLVDFSVPFATGVDEVVVFAPGKGAGVETLDDLSGEVVYVRKSSSYFEHLSFLNADLARRGKKPINIIEANELLRTEDILEMVNGGLVSATVVDSYKASYWSEIFSDMAVRDDLVVHAGGEISWAFRKDSPKLAAVVNEFVRGHRQGTLVGNVLIDRYLGNLHWVRNSTSDSGLDILEPLMNDFSASAAENGLDPLMLAAQAYQESELDHSKRSPAGAVGIMQIKPSTALDPNVGIKDISTPGNNIRAGARYLRFLIDRYYSGDDMEELQRWFFALAAYNAGPARVQRMRRQAEAEGYDPNRWLDNVEVIAARKIGRETVRYVRNVFKYYVAYQLAWENRLDQQEAAGGAP